MTTLHKTWTVREIHLFKSVVTCLLVCCMDDGNCASNAIGQPELAQLAQAGQAELQTASIARIAEALTRIKLDYVDLVEDPQLIAGCKAGMLRLAPKASLAKDSSTADGAPPALRQIVDAFNSVQQQSSTGDDALANACIVGMLEGLDRQSTFLDKDEFNELKVGSPPVGGIGIEIGIHTAGIKIIAPIEGSIAERAGLRPGDVIVEIDKAPIRGLELNDIVRRLRGDLDSDVTLTVVRPGDAEPRVMTLKREIIRIESVKYKVLDGRYAYIRMTQFQERTAERMASAIKAMWEQSNGQTTGIILDLRNNPGGLLNAAVAVSAAFLQQMALVVYTDGLPKDSKMRLYASSEYYLRRGKADYLKTLPPPVKTLPMFVLVNGGSASASEIVAGALQDHKRARIIGLRTAGIGTVQTIIPLTGDTAMKLTTARLFRPSGQPISAAITPNFIAEDINAGSQVVGSSADDQQLIQALKLLQQYQ